SGRENRQTRQEDRGSIGLQASLFVLLDNEKLVEPGDLEDFVNLGMNVAQDQLAADRVQFLVEGDQLSQGRTGQVLQGAENEEQFGPPHLIDQAEKLLADDLNVLFVKDLAVDEVDHAHIANFFHLESAAPRLRGHGSNSSKTSEAAFSSFIPMIDC